jgi:hypothetical protein
METLKTNLLKPVFFLLLGLPLAAQADQLNSIDDPNGVGGTTVSAVSSDGTVVGNYLDNSGNSYGYAYQSGYSDIINQNTDYSFYSSSFLGTYSQGTSILGISDNHTVLGTYTQNNNLLTFTDDQNGYQDFTVPGIAQANTTANGITASGTIYGSYLDNTSTQQGFVDAQGSFTTVSDPSETSGTNVNGVANDGAIAGTYFTSTGEFGFIDNNNTYTTLSDPNAVLGTQIIGISSNDTVFGEYFDANLNSYAFTYTNGVYTDISDPGTINPYDTVITGVTAGGVVYGYFYTVNGIQGFTESNGTYLSFSYPTASSTEILGITATGIVYGNYWDINNAVHGFVDIPTAFVPLPGTFYLFSSAFLALAGLNRRKFV